jgi:hypothetical protein
MLRDTVARKLSHRGRRRLVALRLAALLHGQKKADRPNGLSQATRENRQNCLLSQAEAAAA